MYIQRTYWKWDRSLNDDRFNLGDIVSELEKKENLIDMSIEENNGWQVFKVKDKVKIQIYLNDKNEIIQKVYLRGSMIGIYELKQELYNKVYFELKEFLVECDVNEKGEVLEVVFGDKWLGAAILRLVK